MKTSLTFLLITAMVLINIPKAQGQKDIKVLTAKESDPRVMQWMQGNPPPEDKTLRVDDGSFFIFPGLRWSVSHMREFMPTVGVSKGLKNAAPLAYAHLKSEIDQIRFMPLGKNQWFSFEESLDEVYADGVIILHHGKIVYEHYRGSLTEEGQHTAMSVTKSVTGTLGAILVAEGLIDPKKKVTDYVPELKNSAFGDATVRQVMDMTTAVQFSEDYADPKAEIWAYSAVGNPMVKPANPNDPNSYYAYLKTVKKKGKHGDAFGYKTIN